ncbi:unnamed protein product, partial [Ectocarpus sp. 4 AP-2014]
GKLSAPRSPGEIGHFCGLHPYLAVCVVCVCVFVMSTKQSVESYLSAPSNMRMPSKPGALQADPASFHVCDEPACAPCLPTNRTVYSGPPGVLSRPRQRTQGAPAAALRSGKGPRWRRRRRGRRRRVWRRFLGGWPSQGLGRRRRRWQRQRGREREHRRRARERRQQR